MQRRIFGALIALSLISGPMIVVANDIQQQTQNSLTMTLDGIWKIAEGAAILGKIALETTRGCTMWSFKHDRWMGVLGGAAIAYLLLQLNNRTRTKTVTTNQVTSTTQSQ